MVEEFEEDSHIRTVYATRNHSSSSLLEGLLVIFAVFIYGIK